MRLPKHLIVSFLKLILGLSIIVAISRSGYFHWNDFQTLRAKPIWFLGALALIFLQVLLAAMRWKVLLDGAGVVKPYLTLLKLTWAGQFLGSVMLGSAGTDVVRIYYATREFSENRFTASVAVIVDRFLGLCCLFLFTLFAIPLASGSLLSAVESQILIAGVLITGVVSVILVSWRFRHSIMRRWSKVPWQDLRVMARSKRGQRSIGLATCMALFGQLGMVVIFFAILVGLGANVSFTSLLWMSPIVLIGMAIPLSPSGIGTGQAVLAYLFALTSVGTPQQGAIAATVFQVLGLVVNACGLIPFLAIKKAIAPALGKRSAKAPAVATAASASEL